MYKRQVISGLTVAVTGLCGISLNRNHIPGIAADDDAVTDEYLLVIRFFRVASVCGIVNGRSTVPGEGYYQMCIRDRTMAGLLEST